MVTPIISVQKKYQNIKEEQNFSFLKRIPPWLIIFVGILFIVIVPVKIFKWHFLDLKFSNYENLLKIYKDSTWNSTLPMDIQDTAYRVVCYYIVSNKSTTNNRLPPSSVDPYLCTHIIVGFACIQNATLQPQSPSDKEVYKTIINMKKINPSLKILLSVEDISSTGEFARVVSDDLLRTKFVNSTLAFINSSGFDGVDLDWEFPSWPNENLIQVRNYTVLLSEFRQKINTNYTGKSFILSMAVGAPDLIIRQSYEIQEIAKKVDFVNLMSYDYHMYSEYLPLTGPNAPLYSRNADVGYMQTLNTNWSAMRWIAWGMPRHKINVGIPTYGHSYRLVNKDNNGWNAPASGFGRTGEGNGFLSYPDACQFIRNPGTTHLFDDEYGVPYAYNGDEWISYDNPMSVELKASYVKNNNFGGAMIYSLNCDDVEGKCSSLKFALTRKISNILTG